MSALAFVALVMGTAHVIVGRPRNGKSLRCMMHIISQLTTTERDVVTNMVIDVDALQMLLDRRGFSVNVRARLRMLVSKEEMRHFWLHRVGFDLPTPPDYSDKRGGDVDYTPLFTERRFWTAGSTEGGAVDLRGTCYVIDEIHTLFPARSWQETPRHAEFYISQHGKLNDICFFITQNTKLVDPNFYRLAQDFTYCENHRLKRHGRFRGENKFVAKSYGNPVANPNEVTLNAETYALDLEVAECYDTSAGVGMPGGGTADKGERAKGLPLKLVWVGLAAAVVVSWCVFRYAIPSFTNKYLTAALGGKSAATQSVRNVVAPRAPVAARAAAVAADTVWVDGFALTGDGPVVWLTDGRRLSARDVAEVRWDAVQLKDGTVYRFRPGRAPTPALPEIRTGA